MFLKNFRKENFFTSVKENFNRPMAEIHSTFLYHDVRKIRIKCFFNNVDN